MPVIIIQSALASKTKIREPKKPLAAIPGAALVGAAQLHGQAQEEINHNAAQNQPEMNRNRS
jgi:hypothetical protein